MSLQTSEFLEKMRQQFDNAPYPRIPLEEVPKNPKSLYIHNLTTAYYRRNQRVVSSEGKLILDAGCGTGYKSLELAIANPSAKIVGIDLSATSVDLARQRLQYHGFENVEFHAIALEDLPSLGMEFDYINNDEVLYLLPDPIAGLKAMQQVLKPDGIIRTNFHSALQRAPYLQAQAFFKRLGLMNGAEPETEVELVRQTMRSLQNDVFTKAFAWSSDFETSDQSVLANYLLDGDKGWRIPEFFDAIRAANLEFISMVNWRQWDLLKLFKNFDDLPISILMELSEKSLEEQLHLHELIHPRHRLLDLWCGQVGRSGISLPIAEWADEHWQTAIVHLHPQLNTPAFKKDLITSLRQLQMFQISNHLTLTDGAVGIDSFSAGCVLPLLEAPQPITALIQRWQQLHPIDPVTLELISTTDAFELVKNLLLPLEEFGYVLIEQIATPA
jgi:2-polyprenyl-3-methyl-5-hydroxy-6-metoxy-1,4-benzoquinol methylase